jgi:RNAse (barnase) inhibitor barstar
LHIGRMSRRGAGHAMDREAEMQSASQPLDIIAWLAGDAPLVINCKGITSAEEFWDRYERAVGRENCVWFGRNLDALWDALEGGGPGFPGVAHLIFEDTNDLTDIATARGVPLLRGLQRIATDATHIKIELL